MSTALTLDKAAQRVGVSRWTVSRALQAGRLRGLRDNRGRWRVDPEALDAWAAEQGTVLHNVQDAVRSEQHSAAMKHDASIKLSEQVEALRQERDKAQLEAAILRAEADQFRERLNETQTQFRERLDEAQAQFRERLDEAQGRLGEVQADRDHWRQLAMGLSETRPRPQGFLDRLLGRGEPRTT